MEDLRRAAEAYYNNGTDDLRKLARNFFNSMDRNGDEYVSRDEFITFLQQNGYGWINSTIFNALDRNLNGRLGFTEVLTFYYTIKTRNLWCRRCTAWLTGLYFTCVECFDSAPDTYDLCSGCYSAKGSDTHEHSYFLDNHMLLRSKRRQATGLPNLSLVITPTDRMPTRHARVNSHAEHAEHAGHAMVIAPTDRPSLRVKRIRTPAEHVEHARNTLRQIFQLLEAATVVANLITMCTIM